MAHPDDRACLDGRTVREVELESPSAGLGGLVELRETRFVYPYLVRWGPREGDPGEEPVWAVATNLLVTLEPGFHPEDAEQILRGLAAPEEPGAAEVRVEPLPLPDLYLVERFPPLDLSTETPRFLLGERRRFLNDDRVQEANPDYLFFSLPSPRLAAGPPQPPASELERMGVIEAHDRGITGSRCIRVAVLDTGVDTRHEDLAANILREEGRVIGYDFHKDREEVRDGNGHGTFCAGLIGGLGYGVNREVSIIPVRFLSASGCGTTANAIKAIGFALCHCSRVLSNSWGGVADSPDLERMVAKAHNQGALFVAGAGNATRDLDSAQYYPACYRGPNMLAVGGALDSDQPADQWGFGRERVHLAAPGETVLSTHHDPRHGETWRSGTSVSTAFVAGACALVMAEHPKWSHMEVRKRIIQSVEPMICGAIDPQDACCSGGRLAVLNAVTGTLGNAFDCPG